MCLHADDRTARARIRDGALELFAAFGPDAVTVRGIAARAGVSPSLVIRHYNSKNGVRSAVDAYVVDVFEAMMAQVSAPSRSEEHTSELQSRGHLVCRLLLEKKNSTG